MGRPRKWANEKERWRTKWEKIKSNPELHAQYLWRARGCRIARPNGKPRKYATQEESLYAEAVSRAKQRGHSWDLSIYAYLQVYRKPCFYCGIDLSDAKPIGLDRKDSRLGYSVGNVVSCCWKCNRMKSNLLTADEMKVAMEAILKFRAISLVEPRSL